MKREILNVIKATGTTKMFFIMLVLRSPFDILNNILTANMLRCFFSTIEHGIEADLIGNVMLFFGLTILLFGYNMTIWATIAVKTSVLFQKNLRKKVFEKIISLPPEALSQELGADYITRLNSDVDKACGYLMSPINFMHMTIALVNLVISSVIMILMDFEMYVIAMVAVYVSLALNILLISRKIMEHKETAQKKLVRYTHWIENGVKNQDMLSVFEGEEFTRKKIEEESLEILNANMKAHNRLALCNMTFSLAGMIGYLMVLLWGNGIMNDEDADFSTIMKVTQLRAGTVMSVNVIYNSINNMKGNLVGVRRVNEILIMGEKNAGRIIKDR